MGSVPPAPLPRGDELPETALVAAMLRGGAGMSIAAFFVLAYVVYSRGLLRTALMKQVLCLCMCDCLTCLWEMLSCPSMVHVPGFCVHTPCGMFMPVLRTLQMCSVILSSQIAVSVSFVVHGRKVPMAGGVCWVLPAALVLCLPSWLVTAYGKWRRAFPHSDIYCDVDNGFWIKPDRFWAAEITTLLSLVGILYVLTMCRIWRLASPPIVARKLQRVLSYLVVFLFCYAPYVVWQAFGSTTELYDAMAYSHFYQACYLLYLLTGLCNVASYGLHNWDDSCWTRGGVGTRLTAGREFRVVMFANRDSVHSAPPSPVNSRSSAALIADVGSVRSLQEQAALGSEQGDSEQTGSSETTASQLAMGGGSGIVEAMAAAAEYGIV